MYNSLALIALVPLMGPETSAQVEVSPQLSGVVAQVRQVQPTNAPPISSGTFTNLPQSKPPETPANFVAANKSVEPESFVGTEQATVVDGELIMDGRIEVPKQSHIILAAPCSAILMSLKTAQNNVETGITEGMFVKKGQLLGHFDDRVLKNQLLIDEAQFNVAKAAEEKLIEVEVAARDVLVVTTKLNVLKEINKKLTGTIPAMEVLVAEHEVERAKANLAMCKYVIQHERKEETNVKRQTIEATKTNIQIRQLTSPIDGIVTKIEHAEGEYVREGEPVMEITQLDTLRAVCKVSIDYCSQNQLEGKNVIVQVKKNNSNSENFNGKIVFVNPNITTISEYEVFIEIKNQKIGNNWKLQPGSRISAKLKL